VAPTCIKDRDPIPNPSNFWETLPKGTGTAIPDARNQLQYKTYQLPFLYHCVGLHGLAAGYKEAILARERADRFSDDLTADEGTGFQDRHRPLGLPALPIRVRLM
jgi:hypothetical protein